MPFLQQPLLSPPPAAAPAFVSPVLAWGWEGAARGNGSCCQESSVCQDFPGVPRRYSHEVPAPESSASAEHRVPPPACPGCISHLLMGDGLAAALDAPDKCIYPLLNAGTPAPMSLAQLLALCTVRSPLTQDYSAAPTSTPLHAVLLCPCTACRGARSPHSRCRPSTWHTRASPECAVPHCTHSLGPSPWHVPWHRTWHPNAHPKVHSSAPLNLHTTLHLHVQPSAPPLYTQCAPPIYTSLYTPMYTPNLHLT